MPGQVTAVSRNKEYSFSKSNRDSIRLLTGLGVEGDVHAGETIRHQFRMTYEPNLPNLRQVHLMHEELFDELALKGFRVSAGQLGENITTRGTDLLGPRLDLGDAVVQRGLPAGDGATHLYSRSLATAEALTAGPRTDRGATRRCGFRRLPEGHFS